jgi:hypothetical protein
MALAFRKGPIRFQLSQVVRNRKEQWINEDRKPIMTTQVLIHVLISLAGIFSGFIVLLGLLTARAFDRWTAIFLTSTVATSLTGFVLPADRLLPSHIVGIISMVVLAVAIFARYGRELGGGWRTAYVVSAVLAFYLNVFVGIVQAFLKVPALKALAPTQSEPPFAVTQGLVLLVFVALAAVAVIKFRARPVPLAPTPRVVETARVPQ